MKAWLFLVGCVLLLQPALLRADEQTRRIQEELRRRNLYFGDVDGTKGPEVNRAIRIYQERKGFQTTGNPDGETLHSLGIESRYIGVQPSLPNEPVLRSDSAVRSEAVRKAALIEPVDEEEPPEIVGEEPSPDVREQAQAFITNYLNDAATNDLTLEMRYYADTVYYFDEGVVDTAYLEHDIKGYYKRWPQRKYTLLDDVSIASTSPDGLITVKFRIAFVCKRDKKKAEGQTSNTFILRPEGATFKIVSLREQRVTK